MIKLLNCVINSLQIPSGGISQECYQRVGQGCGALLRRVSKSNFIYEGIKKYSRSIGLFFTDLVANV